MKEILPYDVSEFFGTNLKDLGFEETIPLPDWCITITTKLRGNSIKFVFRLYKKGLKNKNGYHKVLKKKIIPIKAFLKNDSKVLENIKKEFKVFAKKYDENKLT